MTLLACYPFPDVYRDRVLMLSHVARELGPVEVLVARTPKDEAVKALNSKHFQLTQLPASGGVPLHFACRSAVRDRLKKTKANDKIRLCHGSLGFFTLAFATLQPEFEGVTRIGGSFASSYDLFTDARLGLVDRRTTPQRFRLFVQERLEAHCSEAFTVFGEGHIAPLAQAYGVSPEKIASVPNCVDNTRFAPFQTRLRTPEKRLKLLFVGRLCREKGLLELLQALLLSPDVEVTLVGSADAFGRACLADFAPKLQDRLHLVGPVDRTRLPEFFVNFDALVLPAHREGSPRAVIEAMLCGLPVLASNLPGTQMLSGTSGDLITLFERANISALVNVWSKFAAESLEVRSERAAAARAFALQHHTPETAARVWSEFYSRFLN